MTPTRELARLLGQLPGLKALVDRYGPTNEAQIDARVAETMFGYQRNSRVLASARSGAAFGESPSLFRYLSVSDLPEYQHGDRARLLGETLSYHGRSIMWHQGASQPNNGQTAVEGALDFREASGAGHRHVVWTGWGWQFDDYITPSLLNGAVIECPGGIAPNAPAMAVFAPGVRMWNLVAVNAFRMTGVWHGAHTVTPASTEPSLSFSGGTSNVYIDELVIENAHTVLSFADCSDIYIRRVIAPGATRKIVATAASQRIRIGEWIGPGTVEVASGGDVSIGPTLGGLLPGLSGISPVANRAIRYDATGVPVLIDWLLDQSMTPIITCATPGDLSVAYGSSYFRYHKRGRQVEVYASISFTPTYTTATGDFRIALPFAADGQSALSSMFITTVPAFTWPNSATSISITAESNAAYAAIRGQKSGAASSTADVTQIGAFPTGVAKTIRFRGTYSTAS